MDRCRTAARHFSRQFVFCVSILFSNYFMLSPANANEEFMEIGIGLEKADASAHTERKRCNLTMDCFFETDDVTISFLLGRTGLRVSLASKHSDLVFFDGRKSYDLKNKGGVSELQVYDASDRDYVKNGLNSVKFILYIAARSE